MAQSMRCLSSKTSCPKSSSNRRANVARGMAPFTAAVTRSQQAAPLTAQHKQQSRRQQLDSHVVCVAAQEAAAQTAGAQKTWYALVASAEFYFNDVQNEPFGEQLREKVRLYKEQNKENDFFLIPNPKWLDEKFPAKAKQVRRPCVALVSPDKMWIDFMKIRLDRVLLLELSGMSEQEALAMGEGLPAEFKKPEKWTAPYSPYAYGWWEVFYPKQQ